MINAIVFILISEYSALRGKYDKTRGPILTI